jgi:large subunit ribosomal protein L3
MTAALLGKKLGMTSIYADDGVHIPCTVVEAGPCTIVQIKTEQNDGYNAVQLGFGERSENKVNKPELGHFKKAGVNPARKLKEFKDINGDFKVGDVVKVEQFQKGDKVRITGKSKGKGFQGVVKRHNFAGVGMTTHGQSDRQRHPGSIGQSSYPSRVFKGVRMAGRMGGTKVSVKNLEVVEVIPDQNIMLIKGSVPGAINSFLEIVKQ